MASILEKLALLLLLSSLVACASDPVTSSAGFYGRTPGPQAIKGSYGQRVHTFVVNYDAEDVRHSVKKAAGFDGLVFDIEKANMLSGVGHWVPPGFTGGCAPDQVFAVYIEKVGKQKSKVTVVVDHLSLCASAKHSEIVLAQRLVSNLNTVLATYE